MCVCIVEETLHLVARKTNLDSTGAVKCCLPSCVKWISGECRRKSLRKPCVVYYFSNFDRRKGDLKCSLWITKKDEVFKCFCHPPPLPSPSSSSGADLELVWYVYMVQMTHCQQKTSHFPFFPDISSTVGSLLVAVMMHHKLGVSYPW